jgi:hypothetical protein
MSETINDLAAALALAQGEMEGASKDGTNPAYKTADGGRVKYATLSAVWDACRAALSKNGLSVVQSPGAVNDNCLTLTSILLHKSGQFIQDEFTLPVAQLSPQGAGSAATYARRYALMALVGVAAEDDDGQHAENDTTRNRQVQSVPRPLPPKPEPPREKSQVETPKANAPGTQTAKDAAIKLFLSAWRAAGCDMTEEAIQEAWGVNAGRAHDCFDNEGNLRYTEFNEGELSALTSYCVAQRKAVERQKSDAAPLTLVETSPDPNRQTVEAMAR